MTKYFVFICLIVAILHCATIAYSEFENAVNDAANGQCIDETCATSALDVSTQDIKEDIISNDDSSISGWESDDVFSDEEKVCDFRRVTVAELVEDSSLFTMPFILTDGMEGWAAVKEWSREKLLSKYGDRVIHTGSEVSVTYGNSNPTAFTTLKEYIENMRDPMYMLINNFFISDIYFLTKIPDLMKNYTVPAPIQDLHYESAKVVPVFSLGVSRSGFPFHQHGKIWMGIVHGAKKWFVYPPGASPPSEILSKSTIMLTVNKWYTDILPLLRNYDKAPLETTVFQSTDDVGYQPLECYQRQGEILYLPQGWNHMTINEGETIGVGGHQKMKGQETLDLATEVLEGSPGNNAALKSTFMATFALNDDKRTEGYSENAISQYMGSVFDTNLLNAKKSLKQTPFDIEVIVHILKHLGMQKNLTVLKSTLRKYAKELNMLHIETMRNLRGYYIPKSTMAFIYQRFGDVCAENGMNDDAIYYFKKSLSSLKDYPPTLISAARVYLDKNDQQRAQKLIDRVKIVQPHHPLLSVLIEMSKK